MPARRPPPPVDGFPPELIARLDARLSAAASTARSSTTLAEHVSRLRVTNFRPLGREEAIALGYSQEEVDRVFGLAGSSSPGPVAVAPTSKAIFDGERTLVTHGRFSVSLPGRVTAEQIEAALAGIDSGVAQLAGAIQRALDIVAPEPDQAGPS